ncbi:MAG: hypothetical protein K2N35_17105 [Muribaculaceae bacterium]|nr:hypothetical protein [Muribaculaceae bacterium]
MNLLYWNPTNGVGPRADIMLGDSFDSLNDKRKYSAIVTSPAYLKEVRLIGLRQFIVHLLLKVTEGQVRDIINGRNVVAPLREIQEVKNAIVTYDLFPKLNPLFAHLPVENIVFSNQQDYYDAITSSTVAGESTPFIEFMLCEILDTLARGESDTISVNVEYVPIKVQGIFPNNIPNMVAKSTTAQPETVEAQPIVNDLSEAETRRIYIDLLLREAGWKLSETKGEIIPGKACIEIKVGTPFSEALSTSDYEADIAAEPLFL